MSSRKHVTVEEIKQVKEMAAKGQRFYQICDQLNRSEDTIRAIIRGNYDWMLRDQEPESVHELVAEPDTRIDRILDQLESMLDVLAVIEERLGVLIEGKRV